MTTEKIQVTTQLSPETYQQLQEYMTKQDLSQTRALKAIIEGFFEASPEGAVTGRINRLEQDMADVKRHIIALRFRHNYK